MLLVEIPWKGGSFEVGSDQARRVEEDEKGLFLRVRNASTGRLNKCRVFFQSSQPSLRQLEGGRVSGIIRNVGPNYVALLIDEVEGLQGHDWEADLFRMSAAYLKEEGVGWKVHPPRSWATKVPSSSDGRLGPHVSLDARHASQEGERVSLVVQGAMYWEENSRWVGLRLSGRLVDATGWHLHMSCAQQ